MKYLFVFGNTPELAKAELEAVLNSSGLPYQIVSFSGKVLIIDSSEISFNIFDLLGGTVKVGLVVENIDFSEISGSKLDYGVSFLGAVDNTSWKKIFILNKEIKETLAQKGIKGRFVLPARGETELSSVVVKKQKLTEFLVFGDIYAQTVWVQDFEAWGKRDYGRPAVEAHVGMLPPKVARQMVNLSLGQQIADPFCGTGTILMEGLVVGRKVIGVDIDRRQVERAKANLNWLTGQDPTLPMPMIKLGDARGLSAVLGQKVDAIVTEPDLGPNTLLSRQSNVLSKLENLYMECFTDWKNVLKPGGMVVIALPSFGENTDLVKNVVDKATAIGYILLSGPYLYARPQAKVKRNICVFKLK